VPPFTFSKFTIVSGRDEMRGWSPAAGLGGEKKTVLIKMTAASIHLQRI
jgi:hypothetical protein